MSLHGLGTRVESDVTLGEVTGIVKLNLGEATVFICTLKGSTEFEVENAPVGPRSFLIEVTTDGHPFTIKNVSWTNSEPAFGTGTYGIALESRNSGTVIIGNAGIQGKEGVKGEQGPEGGTATGLFGDGSDGAIDFNGTLEYSGFSAKSGKEYTLTRDIYATNLTVAAEVILKLAGYRIYYTGELANSGTIQGSAAKAGSVSTTATGGNGAAQGNEGTLKSARAGGKGATAAGSAATVGEGTTAGVGMGGIGGAGGAGSSTAGAAAGTLLQEPKEGYPARNFQAATFGSQVVRGVQVALSGGTGGGGGGAATALQGGGGGGEGGGIAVLVGYNLNNKGTIECAGGVGGAAETIATSGGGGGGGGGGVIYLLYHLLTAEGTVSVAGGAGGKGSNENGHAGSSGNVIKLKI